jgi:hypothetical protein
MDPPRHCDITKIADLLRISEAAVGALRAAARFCSRIKLSSLPLYPGFNSADD